MSNVGQRYKDVLFALATAREYEQSLGRLQLQKIIYLSDVLAVLWETLGPKEGHQTYKHGPYDPAIQNAVDTLAFRGAVNIVESNLKQDQTIRVRYQISDIGIQIVQNVRDIPAFAKKSDMYEIIGLHVNRRGWHKLKDMVYSEATYVTRKSDGFGKSLGTESLLTNESLRVLVEFNDLIPREGNSQLSKENLTSIFFQILDNYQAFANIDRS